MEQHGPMACERCWLGCKTREKFVGPNDKYRIVNDPGYWGATNPRVLVLGMSKGNTQASVMNDSYADGTFDMVAFMGFRDRLLKVLHAMGLMHKDTSIDHHLTAQETDWGFASILRCSLTVKTYNPKKNIWQYSAESGGVISSMKNEFQPWMVNCIDEHLTRLSKRTRLVIMLGNAENYFKALEPAMRAVFPDYEPHPKYGKLVFRAGKRFFVHVGHPSKGNGHLGTFLDGAQHIGQGAKRDHARRAIVELLGPSISKL
jgi:hypothetical protein